MPTCPFCAKAVPGGSSICPHCLRGQPMVAPAPAAHGAGPLGFMHGRWRVTLLATVLAVTAFHLKRNYRFGGGNAPVTAVDDAPVVAPAPAMEVVQTTVATPATVAIADTAPVSIAAGTFAAFPFDGKGRSECRVGGSVRTLSGGNRRVNVMVVDREGMAALERGQPPHTYYHSGATGDLTLDLRLDGRTFYTLVVQNAGPGRAARTVRLRQVVAACRD
ncbi:MAG: hypothetical protein JWL60_2227 [Gemmatimonadetes bacterium]|jgi:hypothetical protein|nr:hypothetical protein [Gemmatimonadota bacterium]